MDLTNQVKAILRDTLSLGTRGDALTPETPLLGAIPEFDSMSVVSVLTSIEDMYGITIEDDEISADVFATVGSLTNFVARKLSA